MTSIDSAAERSFIPAEVRKAVTLKQYLDGRGGPREKNGETSIWPVDDESQLVDNAQQQF